MDYFILKPDGEQTGTFSIDQIRAMLTTGFIGLDTRYWHEGISEWQPVDRLEESLNFPEPSPSAPHATPPPSYKLSGSLARAVPSPHQQKRPAPAIANAPQPIRPETPVIPEAPKRNGNVHASSPRIEPPAAPEVSPTPVEQTCAPTAASAAIARRSRKALPLGHFLYAFPVVLLALAIITAVIASRHPAKSPFSKVTLTSRNVYVLLDQASIKAFEEDMRNSPVVDSLKRQIEASSDPIFIQRMTIGLGKETARHGGEITQQYIKGGHAKFIEPGTYSALAYFDDNGILTVPRAGEPWVAITYRGNVVYAYQGHDLDLATP